MEWAVLAAFGALSTSALMAVLERDQANRVQSRELRFGRDLTPELLERALDHVAGLQPVARLVLDVEADALGIRHYLHGDQASLDNLRSALRGLLPSIRFERVDPRLAPPARYSHGRSIRLGGRLRALRGDAPGETSAALLSALQPLGKDERLLLRWVIGPSRPHTVPAAGSGVNIEPEERRRLRKKNDGAVLRGRGLVAVQAAHPQRAAHLLARLSAVLRSRATAYGYLRTTPLLPGQLRSYLRRRSFLFMDRYASDELSGLLGWPINAPQLPGLALGTSPQLMPTQDIPRTGRLLGTATWPGAERPVAQPLTGALSHSLITGPTGVGKSTLLVNLAAADVAAGRGVVLIDGKGDTAEALLARIPAERSEQVIVLDCTSDGPQPGLRLFGRTDAELAADLVLGVLADLFRESWGPLSERYLRAGLLAVAHDPAGTLADVPYVYSDATYRRSLVPSLRDPLSRATFAAFEEMGPAERQQQLAASFNKLGTLLSRPIVRNVLGQSEPRLNFHAALGKQQVVVININPTKVGGPAARLIGAVSLFALFQAVQSRIALPENRRRPFMVYIDEPKAFGDLPMPLDSLLEQARGLGVGLTLAPQSLTQLTKSVREAALTNVATRIVFRQDADDARLLARDLSSVTPEQLGDLAQFEAVARIGLAPGRLAAPVTIKTQPLSKPSADAVEVKAAAMARYGVSLTQVDERLSQRHALAASDQPVGRKRRAP